MEMSLPSPPERFRARWRQFATGLGMDAAVAEAVGGALLSRYAESTRCYHGVEHILAMLDGFDAIHAQFVNPITAELAIFYHDVIYDAARSDNEERSAGEMRRMLADHIAPEALDETACAIVATQRHVLTSNPDTNLVIDLDMAILGQPWPVYERYAAGVMQEYVPVYGEAAYRQGRIARFIEPALAQGEVFLTAGFRELTAQAMHNLAQEREVLASGARFSSEG